MRSCQLCGGHTVNGRCTKCGMPVRDEERMYHLNEDRSDHYRHANPKIRKMMWDQETPLPDKGSRPDAEARAKSTLTQAQSHPNTGGSGVRPNTGGSGTRPNVGGSGTKPNVSRTSQKNLQKKGSGITILFLILFYIIMQFLRV